MSCSSMNYLLIYTLLLSIAWRPICDRRIHLRNPVNVRFSLFALFQIPRRDFRQRATGQSPPSLLAFPPDDGNHVLRHLALLPVRMPSCPCRRCVSIVMPSCRHTVMSSCHGKGDPCRRALQVTPLCPLYNPATMQL